MRRFETSKTPLYNFSLYLNFAYWDSHYSLYFFAEMYLTRLQDMKDQLKKRVLAKRIAKRITFMICDDLSIELNGYALLRPAIPGSITWLDSTTNLPVKVI